MATYAELIAHQTSLTDRLQKARKARKGTKEILSTLDIVNETIAAQYPNGEPAPEPAGAGPEDEEEGDTVVTVTPDGSTVVVVEPRAPRKSVGPKPSTLALVEQRRPSWSTLSTQFDDGVTAIEALERAGIEDNIIKAPMYAQLPDGDFVEISGKFAMVNPSTGKFYGPASGEYNFLQNSEVAEMLDAYITTQFPVVAAGSTPDGSGVMFVLDAGERPVAGEAIHQYFIVAESRTVGVSFKSAFTPVRFACMNTLMTAFRRAFQSMSARHDRNFRVSVADSMAFVNHAHLQAHTTMTLLDQMAGVQITADQLLEMAQVAFPLPARENLDGLLQAFGEEPEDEYAQKKLGKARKAYNYWASRAEAAQQLVVQRFEAFGEQTDNPALLGTVYAAYNSVVEVEDFGLFKGSNLPTVANDSLFGPRADGKVRAMSMAEQLLLR